MQKILENKYFPIFVFAVLAIILLVNNWSITFWDQDEAAYAGFGNTMIESGNYLTPEFTWSEVHRKPPLHFWLIAFSYKIFGVNEFAVRIPVTISIFLVYLLIFIQGKKFFGKETGILSAIILGTSLYIPALGKIAFTDGLLLLFFTLAGFSLLNILIYKSYKWVFIFWGAFALGLLTKGPPIMIFTGFLAILLFILHKKRWNLIILHPWFFLPIAALPLFFWGYKAWQTDNGVFIRWMIDWYILRRVDSSVFGQTGPPGYYLATFIAFFIPFLTFVPGAFYIAFKSLKNREANTVLLLAWLVSGWLFYEFLKSKLPSYVVAAYPALAILIIQYFTYLRKSNKSIILAKVSSIFQLIISLSISVGLVWASTIFFDLTGKIFSVIIACFLCLGTFSAILFLWKKKYNLSMKIFIGNAAIFLLFSWTFLLPKIDDIKNSTERVSLFINDNSYAKSTIVIANKSGKPPSLPFYLEQKNKKTTIIEEYDENIIIKKYKSHEPYVFILKEDMAKKITDKFPDAQIDEISSYTADRVKMGKYYILMNNEAKNK